MIGVCVRGGCVCVLGMCVFVSVDVFLDVYVCGVGLVRGMGVTDTTLVATTATTTSGPGN